MNNIYMITKGSYKWYQNKSLIMVWRSISFGPVGDVCPFDSLIPWDIMRTLCLHEWVFVTSHIR